MNKKAVIFDMDGVIFDSERLYMECCKEAAEIFGADNIESVVISCIGVNLEKTLRIYREAYGKDFPLDDFWHETTSRFRKKTHGGLLPVKDGAKEILELLKKNNIPLAIASSTKVGMVCDELKAAGLFDYFDIIVGGDMVSKSKPDPEIYYLACKCIGTKPENCAYVGDNPVRDVEGTQAAGFGMMIRIDEPDTLNKEKATGKEFIPDHVITKLSDLLTILPDRKGAKA